MDSKRSADVQMMTPAMPSGISSSRISTVPPLRERRWYHIVTVTETRRCRWCGGSFPVAAGPGRPRVYCRDSHRQRAYEARRLASVHRLGDDDVLLSRRTFQELKDVLYAIEAALQDVDADIAGASSPSEYREALWHLYHAAAEVRSASVEPRAIGS